MHASLDSRHKNAFLFAAHTQAYIRSNHQQLVQTGLRSYVYIFLLLMKWILDAITQVTFSGGLLLVPRKIIYSEVGQLVIWSEDKKLYDLRKEHGQISFLWWNKMLRQGLQRNYTCFSISTYLLRICRNRIRRTLYLHITQNLSFPFLIKRHHTQANCYFYKLITVLRHALHFTHSPGPVNTNVFLWLKNQPFQNWAQQTFSMSDHFVLLLIKRLLTIFFINFLARNTRNDMHITPHFPSSPHSKSHCALVS